MTQPNDSKVVVDISEYSQQWFEIRALKKAMDDATKAYETRVKKFKGFIGDADVVVINGREVATYPRGAFNRSKFVNENPDLAANYIRKVFKEEFDEEKFASDNTAIWLAYKTRSLRAKDGE